MGKQNVSGLRINQSQDPYIYAFWTKQMQLGGLQGSKHKEKETALGEVCGHAACLLRSLGSLLEGARWLPWLKALEPLDRSLSETLEDAFASSEPKN